MRKFDKKKRNTHNRTQRPIIAIVAEGNNVTEAQYFSSFNSQKSGCIVKIVKAGGKTDPVKLLDQLKSFWENSDLDVTIGDRGFVVLDLDCDDKKAALIRGLKRPEGCDFIISNPCFEVWFIFHFLYSTHAFSGNNEVLKLMEKYIPDYSKTKNVFPQLADKMHQAIENSEKTENYFDSLQLQWPSAGCNPRTDAGKLVKVIIDNANNQ